MRRLGLVILMAFSLALCMYGADKSKARIHFENTTLNLGHIKEDGGPVAVEFPFTNTGKDPLKIESARAQCGCSRAVYPKNEIAPGESGTIKVTYNPLGQPGGFTKVITVRCTGNPGKVSLKIRGTVVPK